MDLHDSRKVLVAFIGSPGDVVDERHLARKAVDRANKVLKTIDWQIELRGWKDTLPGHGRPQELINADVRGCHLFIGLLWARWGSPTGKYSSGFEEEYRLALELLKDHGGPQVWLFFKKVSTAQLKDPGEQLKKVLEFRKEVEGNRDVLFKHHRAHAIGGFAILAVHRRAEKRSRHPRLGQLVFRRGQFSHWPLSIRRFTVSA